MLRSTKSTSISSLITSQARATRSGLAPQIYLNHVHFDQQKERMDHLVCAPLPEYQKCPLIRDALSMPIQIVVPVEDSCREPFHHM